jgi:2,3-bisphosphoglycerate-dependent phosphoglycerate mutase
MQLYLIRHGQSTNNHLLSTTGMEDGRSFDPELTPLGERQAAALAEFLSSSCDAAHASDVRGEGWVGALPERLPLPEGGRGYLGLTHLYTSPMLRAVRTGLVTAQKLGLPLTAWRDLHEGGGLYLYDEGLDANIGQPGPDRAAMARRFPALVWPPELGDGPWWDRPFEEKVERLPRARRVWTELLRRHPAASADRVAFFSHAAFINYFLGAVLGALEWRLPAWFSMYNCAITRLDFRPEGAEAVVVYTDFTGHLGEELISG